MSAASPSLSADLTRPGPADLGRGTCLEHLPPEATVGTTSSSLSMECRSRESLKSKGRHPQMTARFGGRNFGRHPLHTDLISTGMSMPNNPTEPQGGRGTG